MPDHRPIVYLLHGLLETSYGHFGHQIKSWMTTFRVVPVDLPGHGRCPVDAGHRYIEHACGYVTALMDKLGPGHVVAASYLGGPVAVRSAAGRPDLAHSLVLTGFVPGVPQDVFSGWMQSVVHVSGESPALAKAYDAAHGPRWRTTLARYRSEVERRYPDGLAVSPAMLGLLACPVLILNGSVKSAERTAAMGAAELGPHIRGRAIHGAGHIPGRDRPAEFEAAVEEFWSQVEAGLAVT